MELRKKIREEVISARILAKTVDEAVDSILLLFDVVGQSEQLKAFADYLNSRLGEPMYSTQAHVDEYLKSL